MLLYVHLRYVLRYTILCNECVLSFASPQSTVLVHNLSFIFIKAKFSFPDMQTNSWKEKRGRGDRLFVFAENLCITGKY